MKTITGNTYPVREQLKSMGARWNPTAKGWDVPDEKVEEAHKLVAAAPVQKRRYECEECGDMVFSGTRCWETGLRH